MTYARKRRYGACHIAARTGQIDELLCRIDVYTAELAAQRDDLAAYRRDSLWLDEGLAGRVDAHLAATAQAIDGLRERALAAQAGFAALPRLPEDDGRLPEPVLVEDLDAP